MTILTKTLAPIFSAAIAISMSPVAGNANAQGNPAPNSAAAAAAASPLEHSHVSVATSDGLTLSAFVSRPTGSKVPLPALFLTQWVSCGSVAPRDGRISQAEALALAAGYALIRVDRSGEGASEGAGCDKLDYETEVRHYRQALSQLYDHEWVDPENVVVLGSSLGSTTAPLVAQEMNVAGVLIQGAGALTYFERMVRFDRIQLERQPGLDHANIDREMRRRIEFHQLYLHKKMTPQQIEQLHPHLTGVWQSLRGTDSQPHYGRPYAWHWQAADQNWLAAWAKIEAPVMVVFGEYEQFESRHGHRTIVDTVNRLRPGSATWLEIPKAGHGLGIYKDVYQAYSFSDGQRDRSLFIDPAAKWLRSIVRSPD
ncbi:MAG: alpha/beta hydrolase [Erythrobacter sp.]